MKITLYSLTLLSLLCSQTDAVVLPPSPAEVESNLNSTTLTSEQPNRATTSDKNSDSMLEASTNVIVPPMPSSLESRWETSLALGYDSAYSYREMPLSREFQKAGCSYIQLETAYSLNNGYAIVPHFAYSDIYGGVLNDRNESDLGLGFKNELLPNLFGEYAYSFLHGGFAGEWAQEHSYRHSTQHEISALFTYEFIPTGLFASWRTAYSFAGVTGWWLDFSLGYKYEIIEFALEAVVKVGTSVSMSYWDTNGFNGFNTELELPYSTSYGTLAPFIDFNWLGHAGRSTMQKRDQELFENFEIVGGVRYTFTF